MHAIVEFITQNSAFAPGIAFVLILLAGLNLPISLDAIMVLSAVLAATIIPEYTLPLYLSILVGAYFSAWISYWFGRKVGTKLLKTRWFAKALPQARLERVEAFYNKHGLLTLVFGRFIPFGIRNCIFMSTGISRASFARFAARDSLACTVWVTVCFFSFYSIGLNYELLLHHVKIVNLVIFSVFSVAVISLFWYKKQKKKRS